MHNTQKQNDHKLHVVIALFFFVILVLALWWVVRAIWSDRVPTQAEGSQPNGRVAAKEERSAGEAVRSVSRHYADDADYQDCAVAALDQCLARAVQTRIQSVDDIGYCDDLLTDAARQGCRSAQIARFAAEKGDTRLCEQLTEHERESCVHEITVRRAVAERSTDVCATLTDEVLRAECVDTVVRRVVRETGDPAFCAALPEREQVRCQDYAARSERDIAEQAARDAARRADRPEIVTVPAQ